MSNEDVNPLITEEVEEEEGNFYENEYAGGYVDEGGNDEQFVEEEEERQYNYDEQSNEYRYSTGESEEQNNDYYAYERSTNQGEAARSAGEDYRSGSRGRSYDTDDYWYEYDDWANYIENDDYLDAHVAEENEEEEDEGEESLSPGEKSKSKTTSKEQTDSSKKTNKSAGPVEMGKRSFRWFERKILAPQIPKSEENLRRKRLLEKCQLVRKVSKPALNILFGPTKSTLLRSTDSGKVVSSSKTGSKQSITVTEGDMEDEGEEDEENSDPSKTFRDFTEHEWAMKNTIDFLTTQGCESSSSRSYRSFLFKPREEADFRLNLYEHQLKRRRNAVGNAQISAALQRHAERAVWRAVIDNTKPRYPLPRFILPRHKYLKKIQAQFIGPGSYEMDVFESMTKARQMRLPSTWATCTARFPKDTSGDGGGDDKGGAGSGSGAVLLDPWTTLDKANLKHKYPGTYIPFESTPKNFRKGLTEGGSRVPPNYYNIPSPLGEFIKKKTSLRGPYDCYTPPRGVIPYGYHKSQNDDEQGRLGPGSYEIRTSLVKEMHDSYSIFKGKFGKADRNKMFGFKAAFDNPLWPKEDGTMSAVGQYEPYTDLIGADKEQCIVPFQVGVGLKKRDVKKPDLTAPDYYYYASSATWTVPPKGANLASVFRSKAPQIMPAKMHHVRKERNKSSNKKIDLEGLGQGYLPEEHYAYDTPVKNVYVLEDCKDGPCKGGPRVDPFAIPGSGVIDPCCVGGTPARVVKAGCCGC